MKFASFLLLCCLALPAAARPLPDDGVPDPVSARLRRLTPLQMDEVLWLARCLYSESDRTDEQRLVAWVVRNRVETRYRGYTYREVVLETKQFSAFNTPSPRRDHILGLHQDSKLPSWRQTLAIALDVYLADASERPFPVTTRHFYSPVSMVGRAEPTWAEGRSALSSEVLGVDPHRFQFFTDVDASLADTPAGIVDDRPVGEPGAGPAVYSRPASRSTTRLSGGARLRGSVTRPTRPTVHRPGVR